MGRDMQDELNELLNLQHESVDKMSTSLSDGDDDLIGAMSEGIEVESPKAEVLSTSMLYDKSSNRDSKVYADKYKGTITPRRKTKDDSDSDNIDPNKLTDKLMTSYRESTVKRKSKLENNTSLNKDFVTFLLVLPRLLLLPVVLFLTYIPKYLSEKTLTVNFKLTAITTTVVVLLTFITEIVNKQYRFYVAIGPIATCLALVFILGEMRKYDEK